MKVRQDAWSHEDDVFLAETVLKHIEEGSTQLRAFDEVGDVLNRTSAACGFRWNAVVRQRYVKQIAEAKKERKRRKRAASYAYQLYPTASQQPVVLTGEATSLTLPMVIEFLQQLATHKVADGQTRKEQEELMKQNEQLQERNKELEKELQKIKQEHSIIEEDYQSMIQIMNRARRMAILQDDEPASTQAFKMDKNGNLEKIAK
ncbi:RsfA family transcriptional regulator [Halalkalibacterium halodurans]|uniref:RsfA family transcriptional regulator n=1 Tax=Halalkalibacterium halodurans TaxID=86665 RepID=UPI001068164F|nr:RsfA family transcriptional regulator [Halalkalibacterium halodurans]MED3645399.1 RsfA family transcriptional regulator [Halalkalibacterium halodurans]MED4122436.1 RsfA family transcriptional regulator [Halalkalibacterium halodurans]MED4171005.1 RsfA family transcriptional regulator [Halalkalibacterium halodurans]TES55069.1 RsfA family transcriptional regulator [Halalkalibacterium halodurans]